MNSSMDFNELGAQVLEELKAGKPLFGKDGALAPLLENIINAALDAYSGGYPFSISGDIRSVPS